MTSTWKSDERLVAALFGGVRNGATGLAGPDVSAPGVAIQVKRQKALSLRAAHIAQAKRDAAAEGAEWILVLRAHRQPPLAICDAAYLANLYHKARSTP